MGLKDLTLKELQEALTHLHEEEKITKARVDEVLDEILTRRRDGLDDGYWTDFGFVPK